MEEKRVWGILVLAAVFILIFFSLTSKSFTGEAVKRYDIADDTKVGYASAVVEGTATCTTNSDCPPTTVVYCAGNSSCFNTQNYRCDNVTKVCIEQGGSGGCSPCTYGCNSADGLCNPVPSGCINGTTDYCGTNVGQCMIGITTCINGVWGDCVGGVGPSPETCDGFDNDCDSQIDEGCVGNATCGNGIISGREYCDGSNLDGRTCSVLGFSGGTLKCTAECVYDVTACTGGFPATCVESDSGKDYEKKGYSYGYNPYVRRNLIYGDYCINSTKLVESICTSSGPGTDIGDGDYRYYTCPSSCDDGACVGPGNVGITCSDTDLTYIVSTSEGGIFNPPGEDRYTKGSVSFDDWKAYDYCIDVVEYYDGVNHGISEIKVEKGKYVKEFGCINGDSPLETTNYECPNGCSNGACVHATNKTLNDFYMVYSSAGSSLDQVLLGYVQNYVNGRGLANALTADDAVMTKAQVLNTVSVICFNKDCVITYPNSSSYLYGIEAAYIMGYLTSYIDSHPGFRVCTGLIKSNQIPSDNLIDTLNLCSNWYEGNTTTPSCTDTDGGIDWFTPGTVSGYDSEGKEYSKSDICGGAFPSFWLSLEASVRIDYEGKSYLFQLISVSDTSAIVRVTDDVGNSETKEISDGESQEILGINVNLFNINEGAEGTSVDIQLISQSDVLNEYYCDGTEPNAITDTCTRGCQNGACIDENATVYVCGDATGSGTITLADIVYLVNYVYRGGPAPEPVWVGDVDGNSGITSADVIYLVNYMFKGGPAPVCSGSSTGPGGGGGGGGATESLNVEQVENYVYSAKQDYDGAARVTFTKRVSNLFKRIFSGEKNIQ
jgi:hypothetical protein